MRAPCEMVTRTRVVEPDCRNSFGWTNASASSCGAAGSVSVAVSAAVSVADSVGGWVRVGSCAFPVCAGGRRSAMNNRSAKIDHPLCLLSGANRVEERIIALNFNGSLGFGGVKNLSVQSVYSTPLNPRESILTHCQFEGGLPVWDFQVKGGFEFGAIQRGKERAFGWGGEV